jgi:hypothetical protein
MYFCPSVSYFPSKKERHYILYCQIKLSIKSHIYYLLFVTLYLLPAFCNNYKTLEMIRVFINEEFKTVVFHPSLKMKYAISNFGRLVSYTENIENGTVLKGSLVDGYRTFRYKLRVEGKLKSQTVFLYKVLAQLFIPKDSEDQIHVIHLDRNRSNDNLSNLKWVNSVEKMDHYKSSPFVIEARKKNSEKWRNGNGHKLTTTRVILLKRILADVEKKPRMKMLAKQFGISEMQLYRIKSGENWGHIKV